jgi:lysozyme
VQQKRKKIRYGKYVFRWCITLLLVGGLLFGAVCGVRLRHFYRAINGKIAPETPDAAEFPVRGIDISRYQGEIDWSVLSTEDHVQFAFIKATEGATYEDDLFLQNWEAAESAGVFVGAYHFFRFESDGEAQAENFIATVPKLDNTLPPVVDVEIYDETLTMTAAEVRTELDEMLTLLEDYYGVKPILYTNPSTYMGYLMGHYWGYSIWMSNPYCEPIINWTFWQYSFEGELQGFASDVPVDLNVYNGSRKQFLKEFSLQENK